MMMTTARPCTNCGKQVQGRTDKKFCNDQCRNMHNNRQNRHSSNYTRIVDQKLKRNRRLLQHILLSRRSAKVPVGKLKELGFDFRHHTHCNKRNGRQYRFCYEFGYSKAEAGTVQLIRSDKPG